jgi:hypothetical protein
MIVVAVLVILIIAVTAIPSTARLLPESDRATSFHVAQHNQSGQNVLLISQIGGETRDVAVQGNHAYAGIGARLVVLDISNLNHPSIVGRTRMLTDIVQYVAVAGDFAYATTYSTGLHIYDVSDPSEPSEVGFYNPLYYYPTVVEVSGNYAYVGGSPGLSIVDVSNSTTPQQVASLPIPGTITGMTIAGNYVYLLASLRLHIVDITDPMTPIALSSTAIGDAPDLAVAGDHAYIAAEDYGLTILDVSTPSAPVFVGQYDTSGYALDVEVSGIYAYVADEYGGIATVNIANPSEPTLVSTFVEWIGSQTGNFSYARGYPQSIVLSGGYAFVTDEDSGGFRVLGLANLVQPYHIAAHNAPGRVQDVVVSGSMAYVASGMGGLQVLDVSYPNSPVEIGRVDTSGTAKSITKAGNFVYVANGTSALWIIDVANPSAPFPIGYYYTSTIAAQGIAVSGNYAYLADGSNGLRIIDVATPAAARHLSSYNTPGYAEDIQISGTYAYVADGTSGLQIINVSNPAQPALTYSFDTPDYAWDIFITGALAYVADGNGGLRIVSIANPSSPQLVGAYTSVYATGVSVSGSRAYVTELSAIRIFDVSNPNSPIEIGAYTLPGWPTASFISEPNVYIAAGRSGLVTVRYAPSTVSLVPPAGGSIISSLDNTTYTFPPGGFSEAVTVTHTPLLPADVSLPGNIVVAGHVFDVSAVNASDGGAASPAKPYTITVQYRESEKGPASESTLALYYWDGFQWLRESTSVVNTSSNMVTATPNHFSMWALGGTAPHHAYLPVVLRNHSALNGDSAFDLKIRSLEVTQAVQDSTNSIPLVAGRPTLVRVHASTASAVPVDNVHLSLSATRNGMSLPRSPITVGPWAVFPNSTPAQFAHSFNVRLPAEWLSGQVRLEATIDSTNVVTEANEANNNAYVTITFNDVPVLNLKIVPVILHAGTNCVFSNS